MRKRILLVDDSPVVLLLERFILDSVGRYDLLTACDGAEAIKQAIEHRPDLILMDMYMPKLDGDVACRVLRATSATKAIPIIMVTALTDAAKPHPQSCTDYITKPIQKAELLSKVARHLASASPLPVAPG